MSIRAYGKDHVVSLIIRLICAGMVEGILLLFGVQMEVQVFIFGMQILAAVGIIGYDYARKRRFYQEMEQRLCSLEEKYLLLEMIEKPEFLEGELVYQVMEEMEKSMNDEIFRQIRKNNEFKRYIETWVHEVKLPIASLRLMLHGQRGESVRALKEQVGRIESDVEQVLYYLRSEVPEKDYRIQEYSLKTLTDQTIAEHKDSLILNQIKIIQEAEEILVCTDEKWLRFMLGQILSNAVKYKRAADAKIQIWSEEQAESVFLHIRDNGIGITEKDLPRVFEKTFTGGNGRVQKSSTGMGLYLCKTLAERLGHKLEIRSEEGKYTELTIEFAKAEYLEVLE